jgi:ABC-type uncharacterized transport system substrate-binding protein
MSTNKIQVKTAVPKLPKYFQDLVLAAFKSPMKIGAVMSVVQNGIEILGWDHDPMYGKIFRIERDSHHILLMKIGFILKETENDPKEFIKRLAEELGKSGLFR